MTTITLNYKNYDLLPTTGKVVGASKNLETKVQGGGGGGYMHRGNGFNSPVTITSKTTVHDQIFIEDQNGREHAYQLSDFNLACREGNILTIIHAVNQKSGKGPYVAVINHTIDKTFFDPIAIKQIGAPNGKLYAVCYILAMLMGFAAFGGGFVIFAAIALVSVIGYYIYTENKNVKLIKSSVTLPPPDFNYSLNA